MIGIIITGHLQFASGVQSAINAILGPQDNSAFIDFPEGTSREQLHASLREAVQQFAPLSGVIFLTDVPSGTPFQVSTELGATLHNAVAFTGTNLSVVIEAMMERDHATSLSTFAQHLTDVGRAAMQSISFHSPETQS